MGACQGYLIIADISGYTEYLTASEQEHATPILRSLLTAVVEQADEPLHLHHMEGDAVLAYTEGASSPGGDTLLDICENIYNAFAQRRRDIIANTTCPCKACSNVRGLDLKIVVHHGRFDRVQIGPMSDISGADVILVHRMAKTDVQEATGIRSYAMFSDAAASEMDVEAALTAYSTSFEHFGEVGMKVYDLARAWEAFRGRQERCFLEEEDGIYTIRWTFASPPAVLWEALVDPVLKQKWMDHIVEVSVGRPQGRIGPGSGYHCVHELAAFRYRITNWQPFAYFSTRIDDVEREGVTFPETYALCPTDGGTELRYTIGPAEDAAGKRVPEAEEGAVGFLMMFWPASFRHLEAMLSGVPEGTGA